MLQIPRWKHREGQNRHSDGHLPRECAVSLPWELQREGSGRPRWVWPDDHMQIALKSIRLMISTPSLNQSKQFWIDKQSCPGRPPTSILRNAFLDLRIQPGERGKNDVGCGRGEAGRRSSARAEAIYLGVLTSGYVLFFSSSLRKAWKCGYTYLIMIRCSRCCKRRNHLY
jgi:hypothetical protein